MKPILLDTGCIVALLDRSERRHRHCVRVVHEVRGSLVTCEAVIAESCYLLREIEGAPDAVLENVERGVFQVPFRLDHAVGPVRALLAKYRNVPMDLADASLVAAAETLEEHRIFTLDRHFYAYRISAAGTFEVVP